MGNALPAVATPNRWGKIRPKCPRTWGTKYLVRATEITVAEQWIADRTKSFDSSGIREVFNLGAKLTNPINLSIGQPDFDVPQPVKDALIQAVNDGKNGYAMTQGIPPLRNRLQAEIDSDLGHSDREVFVCSGTSGGLVLTMMSLVNEGDEVIFFDPYFVMYESLIQLVGGVPVPISNYPDFRLDLAAIRQAVTPRTKMILINSPSNPTGVCFTAAELQAVAEFCAEQGICLVSDEIYSRFVFDGEHISPARWNDQTIVIDGFSKSYAMTGLRVAWVHGPSKIVETMIKLQQYTFVCAPQPAQWAAVAAMDTDISSLVDSYREKRDRMMQGLAEHYEIAKPGGAFYLFPKLPWGSGRQFFEKALDKNLLMIPGNIFSHEDSHFRLSFAASNETLDRGIQVLSELAVERE